MNGKRYYVEYEGLANPRGPAHESRILSSDPGANFRSQEGAMTLPTPKGGPTTHKVGYFDVEVGLFSDWMADGFPGWHKLSGRVSSLDDAVELLRPGAPLNRYLCVPVGHWSALLTNGPHGTDVGLLPSHAARELGCRALRVVAHDLKPYPARILEVYGPSGTPPLLTERSIGAANDGGRWVFETSGDPYPFEDLAAYLRPIKATRFTVSMVLDYLRALGVPIDQEPNWAKAFTIEQQR